MAPRVEDEQDQCIAEEDATRTYEELEERKIDISLTQIVKDIRNVDYSQLVWKNVIFFAVLHGIFFYEFPRFMFRIVLYDPRTAIFAFVIGFYGGFSTTMGAHRLWAHRTYKANFILRLFLATGQTMAVQNHIYEWSRDHRGHHKFSETDGDPHNAKRGFFFSHMGWLMMKKHPEVIRKGKTVDLSDLLEDPIVYYQRKFYYPLIFVISFCLPMFIPCYFWGEDPYKSFVAAVVSRYTFNLHVTWLVNSLAHWTGSKPYDKYIYPSQNTFVAMVTLGEGWHNYHHVFPFDYRTADLGGNLGYNFTALLIDFFAKIGWVYDRRTASKEMVKNRMARTGDESLRNKQL